MTTSVKGPGRRAFVVVGILFLILGLSRDDPAAAFAIGAALILHGSASIRRGKQGDRGPSPGRWLENPSVA